MISVISNDKVVDYILEADDLPKTCYVCFKDTFEMFLVDRESCCKDCLPFVIEDHKTPNYTPKVTTYEF